MIMWWCILFWACYTFYFNPWHGKKLQVDDLRKGYRRIVVLHSLCSCCSLIWQSAFEGMDGNWARHTEKFLGMEDYMLTLNPLDLLVSPEKVLMSCVLVVKSLKHCLQGCFQSQCLHCSPVHWQCWVSLELGESKGLSNHHTGRWLGCF